MKVNKHKITILPLAVIASLLIAYYFYQRIDVEVLNVTSDCSKNPCKISFLVINKTNEYVGCDLSIRGLKRSKGAKSSAVSTPGFAGEKLMKIELYPRERKEFEETLTLTEWAWSIQVNAWNVRKINR